MIYPHRIIDKMSYIAMESLVDQGRNADVFYDLDFVLSFAKKVSEHLNNKSKELDKTSKGAFIEELLPHAYLIIDRIIRTDESPLPVIDRKETSEKIQSYFEAKIGDWGVER